MRTPKRPAGKKLVNKKTVNPVTNVKKIVKPPKKKGGKPIVLYSMTTLYPPQTCPHCEFYPVYGDAYGTYRCPHCGKAF
jgi:transposase-like protein